MLFCFAWGLYRIFLVPLETGSAYPPYSTWRADPMGTSVYYEALRAHEGLQVSRNERNLFNLGDGKGNTLFFNGVYDSPDPKPVVDALDTFVRSGGRMILAYVPVSGYDEWLEVPPAPGEGEGESEGEDEKDKEEDLINVSKRWGFDFAFPKVDRDSEPTAVAGFAERVSDDENLPLKILWRSHGYLVDLEPEWKTLYTCNGQPVLVERSLGDGSIVISTDTYFLSNEAMVKDRHPGLLAWLPGGNTTIIFDEYHNGIDRDPGVVRLMREYRLTPLLVSLALLALLFAWQSAASLLPKRPSGSPENTAMEEGQSATAGLNNLLRRSIPPAQVLPLCMEVWRQDCLRKDPANESRKRRAEAALESSVPGQTLPDHYNRIAAHLQERTRP